MTKEQKLNEQVSKHRETISHLQKRIVTLSDKIMMMEDDIGRFKNQVSLEMKAVVDHLKENK